MTPDESMGISEADLYGSDMEDEGHITTIKEQEFPPANKLDDQLMNTHASVTQHIKGNNNGILLNQGDAPRYQSIDNLTLKVHEGFESVSEVNHPDQSESPVAPLCDSDALNAKLNKTQKKTIKKANH